MDARHPLRTLAARFIHIFAVKCACPSLIILCISCQPGFHPFPFISNGNIMSFTKQAEKGGRGKGSELEHHQETHYIPRHRRATMGQKPGDTKLVQTLTHTTTSTQKHTKTSTLKKHLFIPSQTYDQSLQLKHRPQLTSSACDHQRRAPRLSNLPTPRHEHTRRRLHNLGSTSLQHLLIAILL